MALVHTITIAADITAEGAVTGHSITANVDVGGEQRTFEISAVEPGVKSLVEQLTASVLKEALRESRTEMQGVVDAQKAFES